MLEFTPQRRPLPKAHPSAGTALRGGAGVAVMGVGAVIGALSVPLLARTFPQPPRRHARRLPGHSLKCLWVAWDGAWAAWAADSAGACSGAGGSSSRCAAWG